MILRKYSENNEYPFLCKSIWQFALFNKKMYLCSTNCCFKNKPLRVVMVY